MMKKVYFIAFVLCLSLLLSFCAFAADGGVISNAKDGLTANMKLAAEDENVQLEVEVINISAADVSNIAVTLTLPEGFALSSGELTTPVPLGVGSTQKLSYVIRTFTMLGALVLAFLSGWFNVIATAVPLLLFQPILIASQNVARKRGE